MWTHFVGVLMNPSKSTSFACVEHTPRMSTPIFHRLVWTSSEMFEALKRGRLSTGLIGTPTKRVHVQLARSDPGLPIGFRTLVLDVAPGLF